MATTLTLSDGTTTATLFSLSGTFPTRWSLEAPNFAAAGARDVAEVIDLLIQAASVALLQTAVRTIERLLEGAARRTKSGVGARVFLTVALDGEASPPGPWRSEVYGGRLEVSEAPNEWSRLKLTATLGVTRAPWWEGVETQLAITSALDTVHTDPRRITNDGVGNWLQIADTQVVGTLPSPVRLRLTNNTDDHIGYTNWYIGHNAFAAPATFQAYLQGEARVAGYGTTVASGTASGGNVVRLTPGTAGSYAIAWLLPATQMTAGGRYFRLIARCPTMPSGITIRPSIWDRDGLVQLWLGQVQSLSTAMYQDWGAVPIPPGVWASDYAPVRLVLWLQSASGTPNMDIDYVDVLGMDSYRHIKQLGMILEDGDLLEIDEIEGRVSAVEVAGTRLPYMVASGEPIRLWPGVTQRLNIVWCGDEADDIDTTLTAQMWYRPRRSTV